ncbi:MAG TPA: EamA family transporter [Gemmatimonadales bacterium]|nr:EamA family transporter [Gemmatimonadales bacterium]
MGELRGRSLLAFGIVCVVWGSTYLAIRVGVESLPPFLMAGVRFVTAGLLLGGIALFFRKEALPTRRADWGTLALAGVLLLCAGNGLVVWAEQYVDSGTASIYVVTVAIWSACFDALVPGGKTRFSGRLAAGLLLGLAGTAVLTGATPRALLSADLRGPVALILASGAWAFGSVYLKRHPVGVSFTMSATVQMLAGGLALTAVGLLRGEQELWHPTQASLAALGYLVVFGSIVGFTAYGYALSHASPTVVGTYAYVNPVVAVLLGWLLLDEPLSPRKIVAMAVILGAVLWIQRAVQPAASARTRPVGTEPPAERRPSPRLERRSWPRAAGERQARKLPAGHGDGLA